MKQNRILLVEDNPDDRELIRMALAEIRIMYELVTVNDGAQALDYLFGAGTFAARNTSEMPDVIFMDLQLPKLNGLDVLSRLRADQRTAMIPIIILTSSSEEEDIIASYKLGANSYIRKPVDFDQFSQAVQSLGGYWLTLNRRLHP